MTDQFRKKLQERIDQATQRLVSTEHFRIGSLVSMPVIYPSGASVVLEILPHHDALTISDRGGGFYEAELAGVSTAAYRRSAGRIAADLGMQISDHEIMLRNVALDRLEGALVIMAACSMRAATAAIDALEDKSRNREKALLFDKLTDAFGTNGYEKDVELVGASNHRWRVDAMVRRQGRPTVFESVAPKHVVATGTVTKFFDLSHIETPPKCVAVIGSREIMGDWYGLISAAADEVLEVSAVNARFHELTSEAA